MNSKVPPSGDLAQSRQFTLGDVFGVMTGCAIAATLIARWRAPESINARIYNEWPNGIGVLELVIASMVLGTILAGPIVIALRWCTARRVERLSLGEVLWLLPNIHWAIWHVAMTYKSNSNDLGLLAFALVALSQSAGTIVAIARIYEYMSGPRGVRPWTDVVGSGSCILATAVVIRIAVRFY